MKNLNLPLKPLSKGEAFPLKCHGGRHYVPAALRTRIQQPWIITRGLIPQSLYLYSQVEWDEIVARIKNMPASGQKDALTRMMLANALRIDLRRRYVSFPRDLLESVGLARKDLTLEFQKNRAIVREKK